MSKKLNTLIIAGIFLFFILSALHAGGDSMQIDLGEDAVSFSGIGQFSCRVPYEQIVSASLEDVADWSPWGGQEYGNYRAGRSTDPATGEACTLFVTVQCDRAIVARLTDGGAMIFNYNSPSSTEQLYGMLAQRLS